MHAGGSSTPRGILGQFKEQRYREVKTLRFAISRIGYVVGVVVAGTIGGVVLIGLMIIAIALSFWKREEKLRW